MAAGPETQFQPAGLNIPYNYTPVETRLNPPIQLPGTGELWAKVGDTALRAAGQLNQTAQMMQQSPLNPAVQAQMDYNVNQYDTASDRIDELNRTRAGRATMSTGPQGLETVPAASLAIDPMVRMRLLQEKRKEPPPPPGPKEEPKTAQEQGQSDFAQHPEYYFQNPTTGSYERRFDAPPIEKPAQQPKQSTTPEPENLPENPGDLLTGGTQSTGLIASTGRGAEGSYALTPHPQDPLIERQSAADYRAQYAAEHPGSIWSPMRSPMAPPAPDGSQPDQGQPAAQPAQSQTPAAATQADQAAMQKWQEQNAHPVMSSQSALAWMKAQTTLAQDATYLPMGGPQGSPAYAFHMKNGGMNIVPVAQMLQKGAGPLVAAQNTSAVLSQTDQMSMPSGTGAGAPQPVAATPEPTPMPSGTGAAAPQGTPGPMGPPPAPGGPTPMPSGTGMAAAQGQPGPMAPPPAPSARPYNMISEAPPYPPQLPGTQQFWTDQLLQGRMPPGPQNMAGVPNQVSPAKFIPASAQTTTSAAPPPENAPAANPIVNAAAPAVPDPSTPAPQVSQEDADANIFSNVKTPAELAKLDEDPVISNWAGFTWKQDRRYGNVYAVQRSPSNIFRENRYVWGQQGWQDSPTDKSANQQELHDIVASTPGINYTDPQIAAMSLPKIMAAINEGKKFQATKSDPAGQTEMMLTGKTEVSKIVQRIIDQVKAAQQAGMDPNDFRGAVFEASKQAGERNQVMPVKPGQQLNSDLAPALNSVLPFIPRDTATDVGQWWPLAQAAFHGAMSSASGHQPNQFANNLGQEFQNLNKIGAGTPGVFIRSNEQPGSSANVNGIQLPLSGKVSDINELAQVLQGVPYDTMLRGLNTFKKQMDGSFADSFDSAKNAGYRVNNNQRAAREAVKNNQLIADDSNLFKDGTIPKDMRPPSTTTTTVTRPPGGYQDTTEPSFYRATKPAPAAQAAATPTATATPTPGPGEGVVHSEDEAAAYAKNHDSGSYFWLGGHRYRVQK